MTRSPSSLVCLPMTITLQDAQDRLVELIHGLSPGDEIVIVEDDRQVARLTPVNKEPRDPVLGAMRGTVLYMAEDFDAPLEEFRDYMP